MTIYHWTPGEKTHRHGNIQIQIHTFFNFHRGTSSTGTFGQILRPRRSQIYSVKSNLLCRSRLLLCQSKFTKSIFHEIQKAKDRVN